MQASHLTRLVIGGLTLGLAWTAAAQSVSGTPSTASKGDIAFITRATADGTTEVKLGQLAVEKSSTDDVKKLAQHIVADHTAANDALRTLAQGKKVTLPAPPSEPDPAVTALKKLDGLKFDQAWADAMVKNHQKAVALFSSESRQAQDPDVKSFADKTLPTLNEHLDQARKVQETLSLAKARDSAIDSHTPMGDSAFDHVASPASATTPAMPAEPAGASSVGHMP